SLLKARVLLVRHEDQDLQRVVQLDRLELGRCGEDDGQPPRLKGALEPRTGCLSWTRTHVRSMRRPTSREAHRSWTVRRPHPRGMSGSSSVSVEIRMGHHLWMSWLKIGGGRGRA